MSAPWLRLAVESRWRVLAQLPDVAPGRLRDLLLLHVEHLNNVIAELREERRAA